MRPAIGLRGLVFSAAALALLGACALKESPERADTQREALANNPDLKVAAARVEQAAAYVEAAGSGLYPQVLAIGNISGKNTSGGTLDLRGIFASWELDLWGRVRSGREAAQLQLVSAQLPSELLERRLDVAARSSLVRVESEQLVQRINPHLAPGGTFGRTF